MSPLTDLTAPEPATLDVSQGLQVLDQGNMLTEWDAGQLVDKLDGMIETVPGSPLPPNRVPLLAPKRLTADLAFEQIENLKALGATRWPDVAVKLQLIQCRLQLAENCLPTAADALWHSWQRPYLVRSPELLARQIVAATTICLAAGDLAGVRQWLEWGDGYFRVRNASGWFRVVDWLVQFVPTEFVRMAGRWRACDRWTANVRRLAPWCETSKFGPLPRFVTAKAAGLLRTLSHLAYRARPGVGIQSAGWDEPLAPPVETLAAISGGNHNAKRAPYDPDPAPENERRARHPQGARTGILVTRAMGGIGDLLMMTAGLHELARRSPGERLHFAVPAAYLPLFEENPDLKAIDIDGPPIDLSQFSKWINLTDCPAGRVESATAPRVKQNRIDIFARAMGVDKRTVLAMDPKPRYFLTEEDRNFQSHFWKSHQLEGRVVVGLQLMSQESYKDYGGMMEMANRLAQQYHVLVFHSRNPHSADEACHARVTGVFGYPLRQALSLAAKCSAIVSPDSAFVHLAGALDVPCVALFGPTDGSVFTRHYRNAVYLDCRDKLGCVPCWRNQHTTCHLSQGGNSVCMQVLPLTKILQAVDAQIGGQHDAPAVSGVG